VINHLNLIYLGYLSLYRELSFVDMHLSQICPLIVRVCIMHAGKWFASDSQMRVRTCVREICEICEILM